MGFDTSERLLKVLRDSLGHSAAFGYVVMGSNLFWKVSLHPETFSTF